jgi:hydrogenase nickel incorporation protein HypB
MCNTCGCNVTTGNVHLIHGDGKLAKTAHGHESISILQGLLSENDHQALHNHEHFDTHGVLAINLMSSPGSGKTALLEATIRALKDEFQIAVIEGDLETENDAQRIRQTGVPAIQIVTGTACHLDAHLIHDALHHLPLAPLDIVFIENVGNLVCPASFDLGHHRNVTLLSVTEGEDKPAKYPVMFRASDVILLTKIDLLPVLDDFHPEQAESYVRQLANPAPVLQVSAKRGTGMEAWLTWLRQQVAAQRQRISQGFTARPARQPDAIYSPTDSPHYQHSHAA